MIPRERLTTGFYYWLTKWNKVSILEITDTMFINSETEEFQHDYMIWILGHNKAIYFDEFEEIGGTILSPVPRYLREYEPNTESED